MTDAFSNLRDAPYFHLLTTLLDPCEESGLDLDAQWRALTIGWVEWRANHSIQRVWNGQPGHSQHRGFARCIGHGYGVGIVR